MPAGDLVVADFQVELRTTLTGDGTPYALGPDGISGLGEPGIKSGTDTNLDHADGSYLGRDFTEDRIITVDYSLKNTSTAHAGELLVDLKTMWAKSEATDLELWLQLPGIGKFGVVGRPRGLMEDTRLIKHGYVRALATFFCGAPAMTFA